MKTMNYKDLKQEEHFVEASAIRFYMRQAGWVNNGEVASYKTASAADADEAESTENKQEPQVLSQHNWINWIRSL